MWALCTGYVEEKESFEEAALRELKEELGISIGSNKLYSFGNGNFDIYEINSITKFYYINCNLKVKDFVLQEEELSEIKWFDVDEIINMIKSHDKTIVYKENRINLFKYLLK